MVLFDVFRVKTPAAEAEVPGVAEVFGGPGGARGGGWAMGFTLPGGTLPPLRKSVRTAASTGAKRLAARQFLSRSFTSSRRLRPNRGKNGPLHLPGQSGNSANTALQARCLVSFSIDFFLVFSVKEEKLKGYVHFLQARCSDHSRWLGNEP